MPEETQPSVPGDGDGVPGRHDDAAGQRIAHLITCLPGLELDAPSLELVMAALTVEVCDHLDIPDGQA